MFGIQEPFHNSTKELDSLQSLKKKQKPYISENVKDTGHWNMKRLLERTEWFFRSVRYLGSNPGCDLV